ncbi:hypothetical protein WMY93_021854 [Mugilogobius chulae]|uniref:Uncharacterized protein n=1 Tax=Mugilogobius chulae TaxID=88201 RepID=A0AAW0NN22_9GOBI
MRRCYDELGGKSVEEYFPSRLFYPRLPMSWGSELCGPRAGIAPGRCRVSRRSSPDRARKKNRARRVKYDGTARRTAQTFQLPPLSEILSLSAKNLDHISRGHTDFKCGVINEPNMVGLTEQKA